jgi:Outer membrane protein beta-barrel domain
VFKKFALSLGLLGLCMVPLHADDFSKLNFNIGGGVTTPLNPTALYTGISGNFVAGAGYNIDKKDSIIGEFMWSGMPPNLSILHPVNAPFGSINLYTLTANYRHSFNKIGGSHFGAYVIAGGGWYYRYASVDKNYVVPPGTTCQPIYTWWGYGCDTSGFVYTATVAYKGTSAGGVNGGAGFTIRLSDSGWKFYVESRYHYAWSPFVATTQIPVTFGFRFN